MARYGINSQALRLCGAVLERAEAVKLTCVLRSWL